MSEPRDRNDLVLIPRQYAFVKDVTKGHITVCVGPFKTSISDTDRLMAMDARGQLSEVTDQTRAISLYVDVPEGSYVVITNPAGDTNESPKLKSQNELTPLKHGSKVNLPGALSFALWPFQVHEVIPGHLLQMNQYLVVRVINDEEAMKNWDKAIMKAQTTGLQTDPGSQGQDGGQGTGQQQRPQTPVQRTVKRPEVLSVGQLIIIKGTDVSFYIPPTGLEVVKDANGKYVRNAVTLEQLEYCVLVDQNGEKRFEQGPKVVFPNPSEEFVSDESKLKFRAIELTESSGLYIKVTAKYKDGDKEHKVGDELFITGKDQPIYYPRAEHAIVKYGDREVNYATAVPKGEGRYVLNRNTGEVGLAKGPKMLLPDPRKEVIIRRILTDRQVKLLYPDNEEAARINRELTEQALSRGSTADYLAAVADEDGPYGSRERLASLTVAGRHVGETIGRSERYTPPRTVTLNTKYDGAVQVDVWTGYAALVVDKSGKREVVVGPQTILLEFDQMLTYMDLSTGKPKNTDKLIRTAFLRVLNNRVSDIIKAFTADDVGVEIKVSYRVNFQEGEKDKWFDVENYVKLLCDHARSRIGNMVKRFGIQEFNAKYIDLIRDTILGVSEAGMDGAAKKPRPGMTFEENGMHVYDVEVLELMIGDREISQQLIQAQHQAVRDSLQISRERRQLDQARQSEHIAQEIEQIRAVTARKKLELQAEQVVKELTVTLARIESENKAAEKRLEAEKAKQVVTDAEHDANLARARRTHDQELALKKVEIEQELHRIVEEAKVVTERSKAFTPELITALQVFADKALVTKMAETMAPLAILGGKSVSEALGDLLRGTGAEGILAGVAGGLAARMTVPKNGAHTETSARA